MRKLGLNILVGLAGLSLVGCETMAVPKHSVDADGQIVHENLNTRQAVEIYPVVPKDTSYVNFEPEIDYDVVQDEGVEIYDVKTRRGYVSPESQKSNHSKERWTTLLSMWRGGLDIGPSLYSEDTGYNE